MSGTCLPLYCSAAFANGSLMPTQSSYAQTWPVGQLRGWWRKRGHLERSVSEITESVPSPGGWGMGRPVWKVMWRKSMKKEAAVNKGITSAKISCAFSAKATGGVGQVVLTWAESTHFWENIRKKGRVLVLRLAKYIFSTTYY